MALLNFIVDPAVIVDGKGRFWVINDAFEDLTGLSKKELIGTAFLDMSLLTAESKAILLKNLMKRMQGLPVEPYEISFTDKTGKARYAEVKAKKIDYVRRPADLVIFRDITRRKENARRLKEYSEKMEALVAEKVREIKESEEKFRNLAEQSPNMVFVNNKGRVVYANKKAEEIIGYTKEEFYSPSFNFLCLIAPESREQIKSVYERHVKNGKDVGPLEYRLVTKDGRILDAILTSRLITYEGDKAILGTVIDITERKKMEEVLRESEEKYRTQFEEALDAIFVADAETGIIIDCNRAASELVGREKSELVGEHQRILHPAEEIEGEFSRTFKRHLKEKEGQILEAQVITKRGEIKDVAIKASAFELRGKKLVQGIFRDVTEQKKAEEKMTYERGLFNVLMDNIPDPIYFKDTKSRFIRVNRASCPGLGVKDPEEAIGMTDFDFAPEELAKQFYADDQLVMKSGKPIIGKEEVMIDKISRKWYSATKVPIKDKNNKVIGLVGISRNITKLKEAEEELKLHSDHLEELVEKRTEQLKQTQAKLVKSERLATIGELAAIVGHDLRNPLTGIMGAAYYLKAKHGTEVGAKGKEMLEIIENAINYSNKIINDLLEYSQDLKLEFTETTPKAMLQSALSLLEVPEKIQIIDSTKDKPTVKADTEKIRKGFVNIIQNAFDAMPEGGTLTIKSRKVKGKLEIAFKDTGTGMSEEALSKLKGGVPLFTTKSKGMGFGLPICRRLVEAHGGKISVESMAGKGTTVTVTIPVNPEPVNEREEKWIFSESMLSAITAANRAR
jgi:PAS domain S-box-containing protein